MLTLRNPLDNVPTQTQGIRMASLTGPPGPQPVVKPGPGARKAVPAPKPAVVVAPPPDPAYTVETIRAAKRGEEVVKK